MPDLADAQADGPFSPKQMRALKLATSIMGIMIIICVILLGIGLSRQSEKLASKGPAPVIKLSKDTVIHALAADGQDGIWIYSQTGDEEGIYYYKSSGAEGRQFVIERQ